MQEISKLEPTSIAMLCIRDMDYLLMWENIATPYATSDLLYKAGRQKEQLHFSITPIGIFFSLHYLSNQFLGIVPGKRRAKAVDHYIFGCGMDDKKMGGIEPSRSQFYWIVFREKITHYFKLSNKNTLLTNRRSEMGSRQSLLYPSKPF